MITFMTDSETPALAALPSDRKPGNEAVTKLSPIHGRHVTITSTH